MKAARTGPNAFTLEFESEAELREEHRANLSQGGLRLPVADRPALFSPAELTLRGPSGCETRVKGTVVAPLPDGVALSFEGEGAPVVRQGRVERCAGGVQVPQDPLGVGHAQQGAPSGARAAIYGWLYLCTTRSWIESLMINHATERKNNPELIKGGGFTQRYRNPHRAPALSFGR